MGSLFLHPVVLHLHWQPERRWKPLCVGVSWMIYRKTGIALPPSLSPSGFRESTKQHRALKHMKGIQPGLLTNSYLSRPRFTGTAAEESVHSHLPHADRKWGHYQTGAWRWQLTTILSVSRISERKFLLYSDGELCLFLCARNHFSRCFSVFMPSGCWNKLLFISTETTALYTTQGTSSIFHWCCFYLPWY